MLDLLQHLQLGCVTRQVCQRKQRGKVLETSTKSVILVAVFT